MVVKSRLNSLNSIRILPLLPSRLATASNSNNNEFALSRPLYLRAPTADERWHHAAAKEKSPAATADTEKWTIIDSDDFDESDHFDDLDWSDEMHGSSKSELLTYHKSSNVQRPASPLNHNGRRSGSTGGADEFVLGGRKSIPSSITGQPFKSIPSTEKSRGHIEAEAYYPQSEKNATREIARANTLQAQLQFTRSERDITRQQQEEAETKFRDVSFDLLRQQTELDHLQDVKAELARKQAEIDHHEEVSRRREEELKLVTAQLKKNQKQWDQGRVMFGGAAVPEEDN